MNSFETFLMTVLLRPYTNDTTNDELFCSFLGPVCSCWSSPTRRLPFSLHTFLLLWPYPVCTPLSSGLHVQVNAHCLPHLACRGNNYFHLHQSTHVSDHSNVDGSRDTHFQQFFPPLFWRLSSFSRWSQNATMERHLGLDHSQALN